MLQQIHRGFQIAIEFLKALNVLKEYLNIISVSMYGSNVSK